MLEIVFTVEAILQTDGTTFVDGRVCKAPIRLGDVFTRLYGHSQRWDAVGGKWVEIDPGPTLSIALRIESIESYKRFFDELPSGMTARIELSGAGVELLQEGKIIGDQGVEYGQNRLCTETGCITNFAKHRTLETALE